MPFNFNFRYIIGISIVSALGGLLFGYDWVVIGGAKPFYERFFNITNSTTLQGLGMSSALIGCVFGAAFAGGLSDRFGRKIILMFSALLFTVSAIGTGFVYGITGFVIYRLIGGLGIGLASTISPMYIAEVSPADYRGRFVSLNQLTIVIGILAAQIINYLIAEAVPQGVSNQAIVESWNGQMGWRWMFWAETIPAGLFLLFVFFIPESPRWLLKANQSEKSLKVLTRIGGNDYAGNERTKIDSTLKNTGAGVEFSILFEKKIRPIILIGIILAVFQQWCGINVVFNYAEEIFAAAGYGVTDILFNIILTGSVNLIFTLVAIQTVDKWGRKNLMLFGSSGLAVAYVLLGASYFFAVKGMLVLVFVVTAIAVYSMSLAPVTWVVLSEIFPNRVRGAAMSIATTSLWIACTILTFTFPFLNRHLNSFGSFWLYAAICVAGFIFIKTKLPETKGKSLEQIEATLTG
ncbi:MAG: sugar porter family MFS transporter [Ignavibacteriaceae bacterium]